MSTGDSTSVLARFRNRTLAELEHQHSRSALPQEEYERRVGLAQQAGSPSELRPLLSDLIGTPGDRSRPVETRDPVEQAVAHPIAHPSDSDSDLVLAVMSGTTRDGHWEPADSIQAVSIMGHVTLDFRDAAIFEGTTEVRCFALMGSATIVVPPDLHVAVEGVGFMGGFGNVRRTAPDPGAPLIRIGGFAIMGWVDVKVLDYHEELEDAGE